eukprot:scaffold21566_cov73-Cyclotella_meneghiniana.AAC.20
MPPITGAQPIDATITVLDLSGVQCLPKRCGNGLTRGIKRLSNKEYATFSDNTDTVITAPNTKAVVSCHFSDGRVDQFASLPMMESCRSVQTNTMVMRSVGQQVSNQNGNDSSIQFSEEIQQKIIKGTDGKTEISIPASVSLHVGLIVDGSDIIHHLGTATVLISGNDQTLELCVPLEAADKATRQKKMFRRKDSAYSFDVTSMTMLKVKLDVVAKHYQVNAMIRGSLSDDASTLAPTIASKESMLKTRLAQLEMQKKLQALHEGQPARSAPWDEVSDLPALRKSSVNDAPSDEMSTSLRKIGTRRSKVSLLKSSLKTLVSHVPGEGHVMKPFAGPKKKRLFQLKPFSEDNAPDVTVLSQCTPTSVISINQTNNEGAEIVLTPKRMNTAAAPHGNSAASPLTRSWNGSESTANESDTIFSVRTVDKNNSVIKSTDDKSNGTPDTHSSSDRSSNDGIVIAPTQVTFDEAEKVTAAPQYSDERVNSSEREKLFTEDVTAQLDEIVRSYSMRINAEKNRHSGADFPISVKSKAQDNESKLSTSDDVDAKALKEAINTSESQKEIEATTFAQILLNAFSSPSPDRPKSAQTLGTVSEYDTMLTGKSNDANSASQSPTGSPKESPSQPATHEDVEVSVDGVSNSPYELAETKKLLTPKFQKKFCILRNKASKPTVSTAISFEQTYITVNHSMSSLEELVSPIDCDKY